MYLWCYCCVCYYAAVDQVSDSPIYELDDDEEDADEKGVNVYKNTCHTCMCTMYVWAHTCIHTCRAKKKQKQSV